MPKTLFKTGYTNSRHWRILLSSDWATLTPWAESGEALPYFGKDTIFTPDQTTRLDTFYLGPFALIYARLLD